MDWPIFVLSGILATGAVTYTLIDTGVLPGRIDRMHVPVTYDYDPEITIVHQVWFPLEDGRSPERWARIAPVVNTVRSACEGAPDKLLYRLWTEEDARQLMSSCSPSLYTIFERLPRTINRVDFFKIVLMKVYGGLYLDTDIVCNCDLAAFIQSLRVGKVVLSVASETGVDKKTGLLNELYSDFLFAPYPDMPFWTVALNEIADTPKQTMNTETANVTTGPYLISRVAQSMIDDVVFVPASRIKPMHYTNQSRECNLNSSTFDLKKCTARFPGIEVFSLYQGSWVSK